MFPPAAGTDDGADFTIDTSEVAAGCTSIEPMSHGSAAVAARGA